jgi:DnaJ-class molecular chaperone
MDYYSSLGLKRGASDAEIKKAYRSMAMKHHPDRGGDEKKFKEVSVAYDILSDPQKKQMYDMGMDPNNPQQQTRGGFGSGPFEFHFGQGGNPHMDDIFNHFGFGFAQQRPAHKNKSFSITIELSLEDVLNGKNVQAEIGIPGGKQKLININIPPGLDNGQQIKYQGMGDDSVSGVRPGDLIVNVFVRHHHLFAREGDNLIFEKKLSVWEAMLGSQISVPTIDGKDITLIVPPGSQPDTMLTCQEQGLPNARSKRRGMMFIRLRVEIPKNLTPAQQNLIQQMKNEL